MNPGQGGVSDAQAMTQLIGSLPPVDPIAPGTLQPAAPAAQPQIDLNFDVNPAPDPFNAPAPAPQIAAPAPLYPQAQPVVPAPPSFQPYQPPYQPPAAPAAPPAAPAAPQPGQPTIPGFDPNAIPVGLPQVAPTAPAAPVGDQAPAWAEQLMEQIKQNNAGNQPEAGWDPKSFQDIDKRIEERATAIAEAKLTAAEQQRTQQAQLQEQQRRQADAAIDQALSQLRTTGYLPAIANPNDPNDPGRLAQAELIAYTLATGGEDLTKAAPTLYALHQSGYGYDRTQNKLVRRGSQTAAAQAPIAGAAPTAAAPAAGQGPSHADLVNLDMSALMDRAQREIPQ